MLSRIGPAGDYTRWPQAGPLLTRPIRTELIVNHWDELLRLGASLKFGHATASLVLAKLQTGSRQHTLAQALLEYGRVLRTRYVLRYLTDLDLRRRVHRQLNKGESLHALRRRLFFAHEGHVRRRHHDDQTEQALCLTVVTNAVVIWNTVYLHDALDHLTGQGHAVDDELRGHLSPALVDHLNPYGSYTFDTDQEDARPGRRPLRI